MAPNGTLTFTPAPGLTGSAVVTVTLSDNGGTANGGVNSSLSQTFTINVVQGTTATAVTSSNSNALVGHRRHVHGDRDARCRRAT